MFSSIIFHLLFCIMLYLVFWYNESCFHLLFLTNDYQTRMKEKRTEIEATASTDGSANIADIENQVFAEVLGPEDMVECAVKGHS